MCFQQYACTFRLAPRGIPNISIPVDVFDVFEATQHTLEHDSKHGRGSLSVEQWCTSPLRSVWRVYKPNPLGHVVSGDSLLLCCSDWLHVAQCTLFRIISPPVWKRKEQTKLGEQQRSAKPGLVTSYGTHLTGYLTQQQQMPWYILFWCFPCVSSLENH